MKCGPCAMDSRWINCMTEGRMQWGGGESSEKRISIEDTTKADSSKKIHHAIIQFLSLKVVKGTHLMSCLDGSERKLRSVALRWYRDFYTKDVS
ncbi:hypothetical protein AVEN_85643-1 [Araneus ventricosus]|uniref:Uncharacterized protein n=1 Tax=Araneus ventricosus TaxID=182803 RepID=A0A4Y1ZPS2_ARAVE|nr:hypothetical protein AVEN_85643-1 [Araneus ventricosus]